MHPKAGFAAGGPLSDTPVFQEPLRSSIAALLCQSIKLIVLCVVLHVKPADDFGELIFGAVLLALACLKEVFISPLLRVRNGVGVSLLVYQCCLVSKSLKDCLESYVEASP